MLVPRFWKSSFQLATMATCFIPLIQAKDNGDAKESASYSGIHFMVLCAHAQSGNGNPATIRNCPAAVSRNERSIGTGLT